MANIIKIKTIKDLDKVNQYIETYNGAIDYTFKLINDLDLKDIDFKPLGFNCKHNFQGEFDGQNHIISNLNINLCNYDHIGFIRENYGIIKNLNFDNTCKIIGNYDVGSVCSFNNGVIENCKSSAIINGNNTIGGICSCMNEGVIENCKFYGIVKGNHDIGGICGYIVNGNCENSISRGIIKGEENIGGICGIIPVIKTKLFFDKIENYSKIYGNKNVDQIIGSNKANLDIKTTNFIEKGIIQKLIE